MAENLDINSPIEPDTLPDGPTTLPIEPTTLPDGPDTSADEQVAPVDTAPAADSENVTRILYQDKEILLIGTAHVSQDSVALVRAVIEQEKPDSVCIELDADRYNSLKNPGNWEKTDVVQVIKKKKTGFLLASLALSSYQKRMAKQLNTKVGGEMIQGMESAEAIGAELVLADRSIQTTFLRIWRKLNAWDKAKLMMNLFFSFDEDTELTEQDLQDLLGADMLESALNDVRKEFPRIGEILISERDQHLAAKNLQLGHSGHHSGLDHLWVRPELGNGPGAAVLLDSMEWHSRVPVHRACAGSPPEHSHRVCCGTHQLTEPHAGLWLVCGAGTGGGEKADRQRRHGCAKGHILLQGLLPKPVPAHPPGGDAGQHRQQHWHIHRRH